MRKSRFLRAAMVGVSSSLLALSSTSAASAASAASACPGADSAVSAASLDAARAAMLCLLNNERTDRGMTALVENTALDQATDKHAVDMVSRNYTDARTPEGQDARDMAAAEGYPYGQVRAGLWAAEGKTPYSNAVQTMVNDAVTCAYVLDPAYTDIGIGVAPSAKGPRWSIIFGSTGTSSAPNAACPAKTLLTPSTASSPTAAAQALAQQGPSTVAGTLGFPTAKACKSRRAFFIRVREPKPITLKSATLTLAGKKIITRRLNGRLTGLVDLRGFPAGSFTLGITAKTTTGVTLKGKRVYKTCGGGNSNSKAKL